MSLRLPSALLLLLSASAASVGCSESGAEDEDPNYNRPIDPVNGTNNDGSAAAPFDSSTPGTFDSGWPTPGTTFDASTPAADAAAADAMPALDAAQADAAQPDAAQPDAGPGDNSCLAGITNYQSAGPFKFTTKTSGAIKFWVPTVAAGCKVPIVHLANGTTANCGNYQGALERLASHGFLTACYEDTNTGGGAFGVNAFETALSMFPELADNKLGSTGHSQGGQAAIVTLQLSEAKWGDKMIYAGLAMEPASGYGTQPTGQTWKQSYAKVKSPVFMFSGNSGTGFVNSSLTPGVISGQGDGLVGISWVQEGFDALSDSIEAYHWLADGATHIPTPVLQEQQVSIPWFRWKLLGDKAACEFFKKMPQGSSKWKVQKEQNAKPCQ